MNQTLPFQPEVSGPRPSRLAVGLALSFLLHAALLFAWRQGPPARPPPHSALAPITVWLRPPPPPKPVPAPVPASAGKAPAARAATPRRRVAADVIALPQEADAAAPPHAFTVEPPEPAAPRFDHDAARRLARQVASEPDPARAGMAVAQLPAKPLATETKAARAIARAKRRDCKDGLPGGLLGPLLLLMDKKDSGCKW